MQQVDPIQNQNIDINQAFTPEASFSDLRNPRAARPELANSSPIPAIEIAAKHCAKNEVIDNVFEIVRADKQCKSLQFEQIKLMKEYFELTEKLQLMKAQNQEDSKEYQNFSLRKNSVSIDINVNKRKLEQFCDDYLSGNPISSDVNNGISCSLSVAAARSDFSALIASFTDIANTGKTNEVFDVYRKINSPEISEQERSRLIRESIGLIDQYINQNGSLFDKSSEFKNIEAAYNQKNLDTLLELTRSYFSDVVSSSKFTNYSSKAQVLFENLASSPYELLEQLGIIIKRNDIIFDKDTDPDSLIRSLFNPNEELRLDEKEFLKSLKSRLWDTEKVWQDKSIGESDITAILTSYATLKRLSELMSSFESKLEEIGNSSLDQEQKSEERKDTIEKLWQTYFNTSKHIYSELGIEISNYLGSKTQIDNLYLTILRDSINGNQESKTALEAIHSAIENNNLQISSEAIKASKILNDPSHPSHQEYQERINGISPEFQDQTSYIYQLSKPYHGLVGALDVIDKNTAQNYSSEVFDNHLALMEQTLDKINPAFNQIMGYLEKTGASPDSIDKILETFVNENTTHPEIDKIRQFQEQFKTRFKRIF